MMLKEEKNAIIEANKMSENDTGSPEVQIAILTKRINDLNAHLRLTTTTTTPEEVFLRW